MKLQVNRVAHPVTVLGPGRRVALWVQGCQIHCPGCGSTDTWDPIGGRTLDTTALALELAEIVTAEGLTGLTITGGEPTEQAEALADLVLHLRAKLDDQPSLSQRSQALDVLVFTGLSAKAASRQAAALLAVTDAAVCGPYRPDQPSSAALIASANQELITMTPLGQSRFAALDQLPDRSLQTHVADGEITLIGLPDPGDLPRLEQALRRRGVTMKGRSWQTP